MVENRKSMLWAFANFRRCAPIFASSQILPVNPTGCEISTYRFHMVVKQALRGVENRIWLNCEIALECIQAYS